jgi:ParB-like chromosome segregation protein Spo0J
VEKQVKMAFKPECILVRLEDLMPLKKIPLTLRGTPKYKQILASVAEIGLVEPLVIYPAKEKRDKYLILDGHLRYEILKALGAKEAQCLISTDDEGFTYNKRVNNLTTVAEHFMILKAIRNGVPEKLVAKVLDVNVARIRQQLNLLDGICPEAVETLKNRRVTPDVFKILRKMQPARQSEVADLMAAANRFSAPYADALLAATSQAQLVHPEKPKIVRGLSAEKMARMEAEMENLQRRIGQIETSFANEYFALTMARGYLAALLGNSRVVRYLTQKHLEILRELQSVLEDVTAEMRGNAMQARGALSS